MMTSVEELSVELSDDLNSSELAERSAYISTNEDMFPLISMSTGLLQYYFYNVWSLWG